MNITGKVIAIDLNATVKGKNGTYKGAELIYKDLADGQAKTKAFHENAFKFNAALKNGLTNLEVGDEFTAVLEKKDDFWNWVNVSKGVSAPPANIAPASTSAKSTSSTYTTAEERAETQKYIVRQSSITAALKLIEINGKKNQTANDVITIAEYFEAWVFGKQAASTKLAKKAAPVVENTDNEDDIPL